MPTAHCVSTTDGTIIAVDKSFCELLQKDEVELIGASYRSITHADDLAKSVAMLNALIDRAPPISVSKRYIRSDGEIVHVQLLVSMFSDANRVISTLSWGRRRETDLSPGRLWQAALHVKHVTGVRKLELGIDICSDYVSEIMIHIYLAEAEGRIVSVDQLSCSTDLNRSTALRWVKVLELRGLIQADDCADAVQFTHSGLTKMERVLGAMLQPLDTLEWAGNTEESR